MSDREWIVRQCSAVHSLVAYYVALLSVSASEGPRAFESIFDQEQAEYLRAARTWFDELVRKWKIEDDGIEDFAVSCIATLRAQSPLFRMATDESPCLRRILQ